MPLPIIIEQTARWYWLAVPLAALPAFVVIAGLFSLIRKRATPRFVRLAVLLPFALWAGYFLMAPVGWQTRFDKDGITITAPYDPIISTAGHIDWNDLKEIRFDSKAIRGGSTSWIEFEGAGGASLELQNLHNYPASFWPALIAAIESNAPQARFMPNKRDWLVQFKQEIDPETAPFSSFRGYVVRDGSGQILR